MRKWLLIVLYGFLIRNFLKIVVGIQFKRASFLQHEKQFIIVANHNSHLDTMAIMASLPYNVLTKVRPVAAHDHFAKTKWQEKTSNFLLNTLLIHRKRDLKDPSKDPIHQMIKALDEGYSLIIFPEGTRGLPEVEQPLKPGIGLVLSQRPTIRFVPAYMKGMGKAMPKDDNLIVPFNASLTYGSPTDVESTDVEAILKQVEAHLHFLRDKDVAVESVPIT